MCLNSRKEKKTKRGKENWKEKIDKIRKRKLEGKMRNKNKMRKRKLEGKMRNKEMRKTEIKKMRKET